MVPCEPPWRFLDCFPGSFQVQPGPTLSVFPMPMGLSKRFQGVWMVIGNFNSKDCEYDYKLLSCKFLQLTLYSWAKEQNLLQMNSLRAEMFPALGKLLDGAPGQVIGHSNDELGLWIMVFPYLIMNNVGSLLILIYAGGRIVRSKDTSMVCGNYRNFLEAKTDKLTELLWAVITELAVSVALACKSFNINFLNDLLVTSGMLIQSTLQVRLN
ncbi:hypothetical protein VP01_2755g4 [Puccinia sorghi]|uniref:Uncharacterized protein n=1 Tax=Puccinia sorghi TaxID=27349 RepID=A0A0L6V302_9BASI|nr:hypothetical protein VP01_2755g4 [Puccinia sorghi]